MSNHRITSYNVCYTKLLRLILCHHYQHEDVFQFADLTGDSLKLAREAAESGKYPYIIFCGVHFMAESADILTDDDQGKNMAGMRDILIHDYMGVDLITVWKVIKERLPELKPLLKKVQT